MGDATINATFVPANPERYTTSNDSAEVSVENQIETTTSVELSPAAPRVGEETTLQATVTPANVAGSVQFSVAGETMSAAVEDGVATATHVFDATGPHTVTAEFVPASDRYAASSGQATATVESEATQTDLSLDAVEVIAGDTLSATATITPAEAGGYVEFTVGEQSQTVPVTNGTATAEFTLVDIGTATVDATFVPAAPERHTTSSDSATVEVDAESTQLDIHASENPVLDEPTTLTATIDPGVAGTVTFTVDGEEYTADVIDGVATAAHVFTEYGEYAVSAAFTPEDTDRYAGASADMTIVLESDSGTGSLADGSLEIAGSLFEWIATLDFGSLTAGVGSTADN